MSASPEARFAADYIRREKRERLLHELTDPQKRDRGLDRFCHHAGELIDPRKIALQGDDLARQPAFHGGRRSIATLTGTKRCQSGKDARRFNGLDGK